MRTLAHSTPATATITEPAPTLVNAITGTLGELDRYEIADLTDDVEVAELVGKLRVLTGLLVTAAER